MRISKLGHEFSVLNIPDGNKSSIVCRDHRLKCSIVESECNWELMRGLDLLLSLEEPQVELTRAKQDVVSVLVEDQGRQTIFWTVADLVEDRLDADVVTGVPDANHFVRAKGDQVVSVFVESEVLNTCGVAIEVTESMSGKWIPHDDVSFFSATCNKPMD